jgi:hypothetical protein
MIAVHEQYYCGDAGLLSQVTSTEESIPSDEARRAHLPSLTEVCIYYLTCTYTYTDACTHHAYITWNAYIGTCIHASCIYSDHATHTYC